MSQSDLRAHFGLGASTRADTVDVRWLSGQRQSFRDVPGDAFYSLVEGTSRLEHQQFGPTAGARAGRWREDKSVVTADSSVEIDGRP